MAKPLQLLYSWLHSAPHRLLCAVVLAAAAALLVHCAGHSITYNSNLQRTEALRTLMAASDMHDHGQQHHAGHCALPLAHQLCC
jgi:hypothetical protein